MKSFVVLLFAVTLSSPSRAAATDDRAAVHEAPPTPPPRLRAPVKRQLDICHGVVGTQPACAILRRKRMLGAPATATPRRPVPPSRLRRSTPGTGSHLSGPTISAP